LENAMANSNERWVYSPLWSLPQIIYQIIQHDNNERWNDCYVSGNECISFDLVEEYPQFPWKYYGLSGNTMKKAKEQFIRSRVKQYFTETVCVEIIDHSLHPDNFYKLYDLGFHENQYGKRLMFSDSLNNVEQNNDEDDGQPHKRLKTTHLSL
jgi:hypothetical protein